MNTRCKPASLSAPRPLGSASAGMLVCLLVLSSSCAARQCPRPGPGPEPPHPAHNPAGQQVSPASDQAPAGMKHGLMQSPINISSLTTASGHNRIRLRYGSSREHIYNKGHTIQLDYDPGSGAHFDGKFYAFKQLHFHTPSEHHIDGVVFPLELHLVHTLPHNDGVYLVGAMLFKEGARSDFLGDFLDVLPEKPHTSVEVPNRVIDVNKLFSGDGSYYHYQGSLTTPPYTETVTWCVAKTIHTASREQIARLRALEGMNARPVQPLNKRAVESN